MDFRSDQPRSACVKVVSLRIEWSHRACALYDPIVHRSIATLALFPHPAIAKALDYSLKRWTALVRYLDDGMVAIDNNWCENQIRPWAIGRSNWLFAGSLRSGKRAAALMTLIQSARLTAMTRMPT